MKARMTPQDCIAEEERIIRDHKIWELEQRIKEKVTRNMWAMIQDLVNLHKDNV